VRLDPSTALYIIAATFAIYGVDQILIGYRLWRTHPDVWSSFGEIFSLPWMGWTWNWRFTGFVCFSGRHTQLNDSYLSALVYCARMLLVLWLAMTVFWQV
jgi:hypothetical protein